MGSTGADASGGRRDRAARRSGRARVVAFGLRVMVAVVALAAVVAMVAAREWLGVRTPWGLGLVGSSLVLLMWRPGGEEGAAGAALLMAVGGLVLVTDLSRAATDGFDDRVLAGDVPPVAAHVAAIGLGISVVACGVVSALGPEPGRIRSRRPAAKVAGAGLAAGVALLAVAVPVGSALRSAADRRAEADDLTLAVHAPAERHAEEPGPARPSPPPAWEVSAPDAGESLAVPGWDVVLVVARGRPFSLTAVSKTDGETLWSYERRTASGVAVSVEPDAGRVLLADGRAAVVLDLADGSERVTRRVPHLDGCDEPHPWQEALAVSPTAALTCVDESGDRRVAVVEASTGDFLGSAGPLPDVSSGYGRAGGLAYCLHPAATGSAPVVVQTGSGRCGAGPFETVEVGLPAAWRDRPGPLPAFRTELTVDPMATDDLVILSLRWIVDDDDPAGTAVPEDDHFVTEVVALDRNGELLWRRAEAGEVVAATDRGVVTQERDRLSLLSPVDGAVVASDPLAEDESGVWGAGQPATTDGERLYSLTEGGSTTRPDLVVRNLADLSVQDVVEELAPPMAYQIHATAGRLIFRSYEDGLVAFDEGGTS